jgi:hypothetical protein
VHAGLQVVEPELDADVADGLRARLASVHREEESDAELRHRVLERRRPPLRIDELPPGYAIVLLAPPFIAAREQHPDPLGEEEEIVGGQREVRGAQPHEIAQILRRPREVRQQVDIEAASASDLGPARRYEVVVHVAAAERDRLHRVGQMAVERREEAKAVLAGKVAPAVCTRSRHEDAPRLAAGRRACLEHGDLERAVRELVRGAHPRAAAAQHRYPAPPSAPHIQHSRARSIRLLTSRMRKHGRGGPRAGAAPGTRVGAAPGTTVIRAARRHHPRCP